MSLRFFAALAGALLAFLSLVSPPAAAQTAEDAEASDGWVSKTRDGGTGVSYKAVDRAVVRVVALSGMDLIETDKGRIAVSAGGHGSGLRVSREGLILTAQHVIEGAWFVAVQPAGSKRVLPARVVYSNAIQDVAFLVVDEPSDEFIALPTASPQVATRQEVFALGFPLDAPSQFPQSSRGIISGLMPSGELQLDMSINPGNSGGPILDRNNQVVGIAVKATRTGIGIAVPPDWILEAQRKVSEHADYVQSRREELSRAGEHGTTMAELIAVAVDQEHMLESIIKRLDGADSADLKARIDEALKRYKKSSANVVALVAAYYWNEAIARAQLKEGNARKAMKMAKALCRHARKLDPTIIERSPFVGAALGLKPGTANHWSLQRPNGSPTRQPPGLDGWTMGMNRSEATRACDLQGGTIADHGKFLQCQPPKAGIAEESDDETIANELHFCDGVLCRVDVVMRPTRRISQPWPQAFRTLKEAHTKLYGFPKTERLQIPPRCRNRLLPCLKDGTAVADFSWTWSKRVLHLQMGKRRGEPSIVVSHRVRKKKSAAGLRP